MLEEKFDAKLDQVSGKVKETVGHLIDDKDLETKGKVEQTKGKISEVITDAKNSLKGLLFGLSRKDKEE
ncbi:CsbD family protein [Streptococcus castoreus]|uniref:CsbD family protein n=1 Tax=Streptococcus castoreus TaxID=254786 RepID=UPI0003F93C36|nr:CsbD family protein [Streptococcus castoreus]